MRDFAEGELPEDFEEMAFFTRVCRLSLADAVAGWILCVVVHSIVLCGLPPFVRRTLLAGPSLLLAVLLFYVVPAFIRRSLTAVGSASFCHWPFKCCRLWGAAESFSFLDNSA